MQRRRLGGLEVSAVGLGCATMTPFYDEPDTAAAVETLQRAREIGVDFLDTSDAHGQGKNEGDCSPNVSLHALALPICLSRSTMSSAVAGS